jgi:hypothetical protein
MEGCAVYDRTVEPYSRMAWRMGLLQRSLLQGWDIVARGSAALI